MTRRAVPEWIGKTPDSAIPARASELCDSTRRFS